MPDSSEWHEGNQMGNLAGGCAWVCLGVVCYSFNFGSQRNTSLTADKELTNHLGFYSGLLKNPNVVL